MSEIHPDPNLRVNAAIKKPDVKLYDVRKPPFSLYGFYRPLEEPQFKRLPDDIAKATNEGVARLYLDTAGGRVRFSTDSDYIAIRAEMPDITHFSHMPLTGTAGFDLYVDDPESGTSRYRGTFTPPYRMEDGYESVIDLPDRRLRHFTIHFPLYSQVKNLFVGVRQDADLGAGLPYRAELPLVYYGSSITQGGCASRPGNAYQNVISRRTGLDHLNLGFSGNGKAEDVIVNYMATLPVLAFVSDYDHNAPNADYLRTTHQKLYDAIRAAHPDVPYIMISRPDFERRVRDSIARRDVVIDTYRHALANGDRNVWYIDGSSIFRGRFADACTVDGTHPNDLGFALFADRLEDELRHALMHSVFDY